MGSEYVFFERKAILEFLRKYGKGPTSKDYEFLVALLLSRFLEEKGVTPNLIGFELKSGSTNHLLASKNLSIEEVGKILRDEVESDTLIDLAIVQGTTLKHESSGYAFQLKRFGKDPIQRGTNELVVYLNGLHQKFSKTETSLVLVLEPGIPIDTKRLRTEFVSTNFPFNKVMIMGANQKLMIGEVWPGQGIDEYDPAVFLNENNI